MMGLGIRDYKGLLSRAYCSGLSRVSGLVIVSCRTESRKGLWGYLPVYHGARFLCVVMV